MDTKWKKFKYGSEEENPSWSFWGSVTGPGATLIALAMANQNNSGIWLITGLWFLAFSAVSLIHLGRMMKNEKKNLIPVELLDKTCPDLVLFILLCVVAWGVSFGWWSYCYMVSSAFRYFWNLVFFLWRMFSIVFMTETLVFFAVILYMSVMHHRYREKLQKKLFFYRAGVLLSEQGRRCKGQWEEYLMFRAEKGSAAKTFKRRQLLRLCGRNLFFLLAFLYMGAAYYDLEEIMAIIIFLGAVFFLLDLLAVLHNSREVGILLEEIRQISEDQQAWEGPVLRPWSIFYRSEEALLYIRENKRESMEKRIQSERMKVDLITNVSHDLKTPLTSMIGCIDLLKQVDDLPQEAKDYVELLAKKAGRLREMIQDVFDMAKATSGGQDLKLEQLDMARLIRQTMADMQDRIDRSGLHFRIKIKEKELPFMGDSKKMYRVYQNLIENTLKYSMDGSRVFVEVGEQQGEIRTSIKNISGCEMDFSAEEIMERFTRGDKSRSTEGNGLGLAIARSFTEVCGGKLQVMLDGDLFRVDTLFPRVDEE